MNRWARTLDVSDVFHADMPFTERRDEIVRRIHSLEPLGFDKPMHRLADDLAATQTPDEWDIPWDAFYDWADVHRVWVRTFGRSAVSK